MFLTVHSTAGLALGSLTGNPLLAFAMGFISHLILDIIPHGDEALGKWAEDGNLVKRVGLLFAIDVSVATIFILFFFREIIVDNPYPLLAGAFGAILPDMMAGFVIIFKSKLWNWYKAFHQNFHELLRRPIHWKYGAILQIFTLTLLSYQLLS